MDDRNVREEVLCPVGFKTKTQVLIVPDFSFLTSHSIGPPVIPLGKAFWNLQSSSKVPSSFSLSLFLSLDQSIIPGKGKKGS